MYFQNKNKSFLQIKKENCKIYENFYFSQVRYMRSQLITFEVRVSLMVLPLPSSPCTMARDSCTIPA
jgi:hypothetical protein